MQDHLYLISNCLKSVLICSFPLQAIKRPACLNISKPHVHITHGDAHKE